MPRRCRFNFIFPTLLSALAVCGTLNAVPQIPGSFTQINMQDGGWLTGIIQHNSGRLVCRTDGGGIYSSDNGGLAWNYLSGNMFSEGAMCVQGIAVPQTANSSSNLILQVTGASFSTTDPYRGIWKTTDGGVTWTQTLNGVNFSGNGGERIGGEPVIFHPTNDLEAWAGSHAQGLYRSMDSGSTWTLNSVFPTTNIVASVYIHPSFPDQIFVGGDGGLWVSVDHGATWTKIFNSPLTLRVTRAADGTVYFGGENGSAPVIQKITSTNWANTASYVFTDLSGAYTSSGYIQTGSSLTCVTVLRDGRLIAGDYDNNRISTNGGTNFTSLPRAYVPGSVVPQWATSNQCDAAGCVVQDVFTANTWYSGGGNAPLRTDNGGQNWQFILNGIGEVAAYKVTFNPVDPNRLYIPQGDQGGAIVTDGGISGNTVSEVKGYFYNSIGSEWCHRAMASQRNGVNRVIFAGQNEGNNKPNLYITSNDGTTWYNPPMNGFPTNSGQGILDAVDSLDNPDDFIVILGGNTGVGAGGVYRTTDAGTNFTQCNWYPSPSVGLGSGSYWTISVDRDATNVNVRYLYAFAKLPATPPATNSGGGMFISTNRGVDWTQETFPLVPGDTADWGGIVTADHAISGSLWLTFETYHPNQNGVMHSTDGGNSWLVVPGFTNGMAADALNGNVVVVGQTKNDAWNKIYYSANNGATWNEVTGPGYRFGNAHALALDPAHPGRIFIGTGERSVGIFNPSNLPPAAPAIIRQPVSQAVYIGRTATLNVTVAGVGPFFYHWQFNGSNMNLTVPGASLTLPVFAASNAGGYDVVVSNAGGSVTSAVAVLSVGTLPGATIPTGSQTAIVGSDVTLNANTSGTGPFLYLWQFNGAALPDIITTVAGDGGSGKSGDGRPATNAMIYAGAVAMDGAGGFYIADSANACVRRVDASGVIRTVAGNGTLGFSGDGGAATNAQLLNPAGVAVDRSGHLFISDEDNNCVREVGANGIITTIAGNGVMSYWGDGAAATNANLSGPAGLAVDGSGNLYIADQGNNAIRQVSTNGIIATVAGTGANGFSGDGGPATAASLSNPAGVVVDALGNLFIADSGNMRIRKVNTSGVISTVAGIGYAGYYGDGGAATSAFMESPASVAVDALGNLYIADGTEHVRKVGLNGIISTVAGNAGLGYSGDGGPATNARLSEVYGVAVDAFGDLYIADTGNNRIREIWAYGSDLPLDNFSMGQSGVYELVLSNAFGASTSAVIVVTAALPPLTVNSAVGATVQLQYGGMPGSNYVLQVATNLAAPANWRPLATNTAGINGIGSFTDTNTLSSSARFYRLGLP